MILQNKFVHIHFPPGEVTSVDWLGKPDFTSERMMRPYDLANGILGK